MRRVDLLRELIHDASAPLDTELRRVARHALWMLAATPAVVIAFGCLIYECIRDLL